MAQTPPTLSELVGGATVVDLGFDLEAGWRPANPTIAVDGDAFRIVVRTLNWHVDRGVYEVLHDDGVFRTRNYQVRADRNLRTIDRAEIVPTVPDGPPTFGGHIVGVEDLRLIEVDGRWYAIGSVRDRTESGLTRTTLLALDDARVTGMTLLDPLWPDQHEKNWMPFLVDGELHLVHTCAPTIVLRCDVLTGTTTLVSTRPGPDGSGDLRLRGGSQGIELDDGWLFVTHELTGIDGRLVYLHRFVHLDRTFGIAAMSDPFVFERPCREFCAGLARRDDSFVVTYGVDDCEAHAMVVSADAVRDLCAPVQLPTRSMPSNREAATAGAVDVVAPVDPGALTALLGLVAEPQPIVKHPTVRTTRPVAGPLQPRRPLTIAMATYDDFDGVWFTVQSLRMHHPEVLDRISILVLDNHPDGMGAPALVRLADQSPEVRYVPCGEVRGTAVRDLCFANATSDWVMVVDSHVLFPAGTIARLLDWLDGHPGCDDLLQGPVVWDPLDDGMATHLEAVWSGGMYGRWAVDERGLDVDAEPFEIPMQGLGCFVARRESWLGFNPRFRGFGGEEGYLHEKYCRAGRRTLCLPFLRWLHRFDRPFGTRYVNVWEDRIANYLHGWDELGLPERDVVEHFTAVAGADAVSTARARVARQRTSPFAAFDAIVGIALDDDRWEHIERQARTLGILDRVDRLDAWRTDGNHHVGCALSHRRAVELAAMRRLDSVLVLEDDVRFLWDTNRHLAVAVAELATVDWDLLYLGGHRWDTRRGPTPPFTALERPEICTTTHAVAYHARVFERLLDELPGTVEGMEEWVGRNGAIDQYLRRIAPEIEVLATVPAVATQTSILAQEDPDYRDRYLR